MIFDLMRAIQQLSAEGMRKYIIMSILSIVIGLGVLFAAVLGLYNIHFVQTHPAAQPFSTVMAFERINIIDDAIREINKGIREFNQEAVRTVMVQERQEYPARYSQIQDEQRRSEVMNHEITFDMARPRVVLITFLVLSPLMVIFAFGLVANRVAAEVDKLHYPSLDPVEDNSTHWGSLMKFFGSYLGINLILLLAYDVPSYGVGAFFVVNAYLIGRWCFNMIGFRRLDADTTRAIRRPNYLRIWLAGLFLTIIFMIPVLNLVAPIIAAAFMTHLFERVRASSRAV